MHIQARLPQPTPKTSTRQPQPNPDSFVRDGLVRSQNWLGDRLRGFMGVGPRWSMSSSLARQLVEEQRVGYVPLTSGMQVPIYDAVQHLVKTHDTSAIPALRALYQTTSTPNMRTDEQLATYSADALLKLLPPAESQTFVTSQLQRSLQPGVEVRLVRQAVEQGQTQLAPEFLRRGKQAHASYRHDSQAFQRGHSRSLSHAEKYRGEWLMGAAYALATTPADKKEALDALIEAHNATSSEPTSLYSFTVRLIRECVPLAEQGAALVRLQNTDVQKEMQYLNRFPAGSLFARIRD